ncbi:hypothetical protein [Sphingomonas glaciei]|uniref:Uncharacterized protein n=1 Tax=Sphingomonas glaciei TaxID=2938948 RepID=A0ABY5MX96_9SPHN|nr:hypothetical protein [Sphingomonas glaciei]UUR08918.1 hypothetical protein M1K48_04630 [Sphingomonas glaciei]
MIIMYERQFFDRQAASRFWSKPILKPLPATADEVAVILKAEDPKAALASFYISRREDPAIPSEK